MRPSLHGKTAVLTGATGEIGRVIALSYIKAGAVLVMTGRSKDKLSAFKDELIANVPDSLERVDYVVIENTKPESITNGVQQIYNKFGKIDILINNAGSAGPKQLIGKIPLYESDLNNDAETLSDVMGSILSGAWMITREFAPFLNINASIINISTIFSKTAYFGRAAYVVPKAALNQLSHQMALEFGLEERGIRVNTVLPGPVESDRIHNVFAAMDKLRNVKIGTVNTEITSKMLLKHPRKKNKSLLVSKMDIAEVLLYLGGDGSTGFTAHSFEVTHGMQYSCDNSIELQTDLHMNHIDMENRLVWIIGSYSWEDAVKLALKYNEAGAQVLISLQNQESVLMAASELSSNKMIKVIQFNTLKYQDWDNVKNMLTTENLTPYSIVIMPLSNLNKYNKLVLDNSLQQINDFVKEELCYPVVVANYIEQVFVKNDIIVIYLSAAHDECKSLNKIICAGVQELIRVWRHERYECRHKLNSNSIYQLIRHAGQNLNDSNIVACCALWLSNGAHTPREIDVVISSEFVSHISTEFESYDLQLINKLHLHKVALITGGSEGIGKQIARYLVLSGARVAITARDITKLEKLKQELIIELRNTDYSELDERILIIANADVGDPKTPTNIVDQTLNKFGRIDYLINNAGIAGEEQMVVDMPLQGWLTTIKANLISNYELIILLLNHMRTRGSGHILNMSSHFGGLRHATVVYPNRADYALSKSGQRILAENLAEFVGPEVQINAVAPGPVKGDRIHGSVGKPGLYQRRSRLILENKRLNIIYEALIKYFKELRTKNKHAYLDGVVYKLANNKISELAIDLPFVDWKALEVEFGEFNSNSSKYVFNKYLATKILKRLRLGLYLSTEFSDQKFFNGFTDVSDSAGKSFFSDTQIDIGVKKIHNKMMHSLALQRMPSEMDVAREVVLYLSNKNVTGETMYPSCGLSIDDYVTVTEWLEDTNSYEKSKIKNAVIMIFGSTCLSEMVSVINIYINSGAKKIIMITKDEVVSQQIISCLNKLYNVDIENIKNIIEFCHLNEINIRDALVSLPSLINNIISKHGSPNVIVSFSMNKHELNNSELPSLKEFENLIDSTITINFVLAQRACLIDDCKVIFVMPQHQAKTNQKINHIYNAFVNLINGCSRTLTATVAKEANLLSHNSFFYQIEPNCDSSKLTSAIMALSCTDIKKTPYHTGMILTV